MNSILNEVEVAALLDCEPSTVQALAREGKLPGLKAGRSWRFPNAPLLATLEVMAMENMQRPAAPAPKAVKVKARPVLVGM